MKVAKGDRQIVTTVPMVPLSLELHEHWLAVGLVPTFLNTFGLESYFALLYSFFTHMHNQFSWRCSHI